MSVWWADDDGAIPFVVVGVLALGGVLGLAWAGQEWAQSLLAEAGGELTVWVLRAAFWALDLVALQASTAPVNRDWYTPVLDGPALPIYALAALVMVATLIAEVLAAIITGNTTRTVQAVFRALVAGMLASAGGSLLLAIGGALSNIGRLALAASGTTVDAPLVPLQEVLMDSALQEDAGAELFIVFLAGLVIVFTSLAIYFTLAMRPVLLAAVIVFLPVAHALSVWTPMRRVQVRAWSLAVAVLLSDAAILTMFAITNTVAGQPQGVDRLIFGTFGLLLAALAPAALARIVGTPELQTAVQSMSRGSRVVAAGAGAKALKGGLAAGGLAAGGLASRARPTGPTGTGGGGGALGPTGPGGSPTPAAGPGGGSGAGGHGGRTPGSGSAAGTGTGGTGGRFASAGAPSGRSASGSAGSSRASGGGSSSSSAGARGGPSPRQAGWQSALHRTGAGRG